jgi:hypothetical protein
MWMGLERGCGLVPFIIEIEKVILEVNDKRSWIGIIVVRGVIRVWGS